MLGIHGLDQHLPRFLAATRPARDLRKQLERAFGGPEIGDSQTDVRIDHANQGHVGNIVPLRDHLRSH